jgi:hypothetical protein
MEKTPLVRVSLFGRKEVRQMLYTILAALFCFFGPTYLVTVMNNVVPQTYAIVLGFGCFLVGIFFAFKLVKE